MKKVLLSSMILLSVVSFGGNVYAQDTAGGNDTEVTTPSESSASVEFNAPEDGKTLTISGHGDLTTYSTKENKTVFSSEAKGKINTKTWGDADLSGKAYDASATYYYLSGYNWVKIEDNNAYFEENPFLLEEKTVDVYFSTKLAQTITSGNFETVKFENNSSSDALTINSAIIGKILFVEKTSNGYTWTDINENLKELDLGQATCTDLSSETFSTTGKNGTQNLTSLTLPLTVKTSVKSESTSTMVEKMVLPSKVLGEYYPNITTVTIPEGYDRLGDKAFFERSKITTFNLPSTLTVIGNFAFQNCSSLASIELNKGLENIGKQAFYGTGVSSVTFPSTLRIIDDGAFMVLNDLKDIKLNEGLKFIGNSAFLLNRALPQTTLEIPVSVRYIGPFAFANREYQDVFFYGENAPLMPLGDSPYDQQCKNGTAFGANTLMGNNGFNDGYDRKEGDLMDDARHDGYANRENYKNQGYYFTILHFPKGLSDEARAKYTDITRRYQTKQTEAGQFPFGKAYDESNPDNCNPNSYAIVGKEQTPLTWSSNVSLTASKVVSLGYQDTYLGMQYVWPSQEQWTRSFVVNSNGYNWDGITKYPSDDEIQNGYLSEDDIATLEYAGYKIGTGEGQYSTEKLASIAHMGTRQFVLANADVNKDEDEKKEPEYPINIKGGQWWTLCVPFNMTKKMIDDTFGENTEVCLFDKVVREINYKTNKNRIVLYFTQNVYKHKTEPKNANGTWNFNSAVPAPANDEIVIYAHESYMIHPTKTDEDAKFVVKNYTPVVGSPTPTVVNGKNQIVGSSSDIRDDVPYRYVGNYLAKVDVQTETQANNGVATQSTTEVKIPRYSYVFAKAGNEAPKFWFLNSDKMVWQPNKCVVQTNSRGDGALDYEEFFDYNASGAKQASFFGEDFIDTPTSIEDEMVIIAGEGSDAAVYSLDGTLVNTTGELTGLAKGVYIKGGKKYVVK